MTQIVLAADPLAKTWGLVPRYLRERQAAEASARLVAPQPASAPDFSDLLSGMRAVDAVTTDLRRRLATVAPRSAPARGGVAMMVTLLTRH